jgi:hypothetical protein
MKIKIQKAKDKFLLLFIKEDAVDGQYLTKSELKKLNANIESILEYDQEEAGDSL